MKPKLKIIILTFIGTTAFWCLVIVGIFWWAEHFPSTSVSFIDDAQSRGFYSMMRVCNGQSQSVTFTVAEIFTNMPAAATSDVVLLERQVPPSGEFWIGVREKTRESKRP
jgi:hypothetical protein